MYLYTTVLHTPRIYIHTYIHTYVSPATNTSLNFHFNIEVAAHHGHDPRCFRLQKDCQPSVSSRKRSQKKVPGSRTAHLEEKLDDLVSLIRSQTAVLQGPNESPPVPTPAPLGQSASHATALPPLSSGSSPNTIATSSAASCRAWGGKTEPSTSTAAGADPAVDHYIPDNEAQDRLDLFRRDFPQLGPVVYIPPDVTAKELQQTRPVLWISIMACTTPSTKESHLIGDKIRHIVSDRVVRQYDRSMDLLQGLLVFLCWSVDFASATTWPYLSRSSTR
jgi:hypothetical protein